MIINHTHKFIFLHVPKAAGTSVTESLTKLSTYKDQEIGCTPFGEAVQSAYRDRFRLQKHSTAPAVRDVVGEETWNEYFTFSFVRNPYSRAVSTYHFLRGWYSDAYPVLDRIRACRSFDEYALSGIWEESDGPDSIFLPQCYWLMDPRRGRKPIVNFVGRIENIDEHIKFCISRVASAHPLAEAFAAAPKSNVSRRSEPHTQISPEARLRIEKKYAIDFKSFDYPIE